MGRTRRAATGAALVAVALLIALSGEISRADPAAAQTAARPFTARFTTNDTGDILVTGNTTITCTGGTLCAEARAGTVARNNGNFSTTLTHIDVDADPTTFNSSSADITLPPGAVVLFAELVWAGERGAGIGGVAEPDAALRGQVRLQTPASGGYVDVVADDLDDVANAFQGVADITGLVQAAGSGTYQVGNVQNATGQGKWGGWALVVVVRDTAAPLRNLTVFDGFARILTGQEIDIDLSGFVTPPTGTVNAEIGTVGWDGDRGLTGDQLLLDGQPLANALNPADDVFNSSITDAGVALSNRNPPDANSFSVDADVLDATGLIANGARAATVRVGSRGEQFQTGVITTVVELFAPDLVTEATKTFTDLDGGPLLVGDVIEWRISSTNVGLDAALDTVMLDPPLTGLRHVPGSITVDGVPQTDAVDGDRAEIDPATGQVVARVGEVAAGAPGGLIEPGAGFTVTFRSEVLPGTEGQALRNTVQLRYRGSEQGGLPPFDVQISPDTAVATVASADLVLVDKVDSADPVVAGGGLAYTVTVSNAGPTAASGVLVTDVLPAGLTFDAAASSAGCAVAGQTVTCPAGDLAVEQTAEVVIAAAADPSLAAGTVLTDEASVSAVEPDPDPEDNAQAETTTVARRVALDVTKTVTPDPAVAGSDVTWTVTVTNDGPSDAGDVVISDTLPDGTTLRAASPITCNAAGAVLTCPVGAVPAGGAVEVVVLARVAAELAPGTVLSNTATVTADELEGPLEAGAEVAVSSVADLTMAKSVGPNPLVPGQPVTYTLRVGNDGPSGVTAARVTDELAAGVVGATWECRVTVGAGGCGSVAGAGNVDVPVDLAPGARAEIVVTGEVAADAEGTIVNTATVAAPAGVSDPDPSDNTATVTSSTSPPADLFVDKSFVADRVDPGRSVEFVVTVGNRGPGVVTGAQLVDELSGELLDASWTCSAGPGARCGVPSGRGGLSLTLDLGVGATAVVRMSATVDPGHNDAVRNLAVICLPPAPAGAGSVPADAVLAQLCAPSLIVDPDLSNNSVLVFSSVTPNTPPVLTRPIVVQTEPGQPVTFDPFAFFGDPEGFGDPTSVRLVTPPGTGTVSIDPVTGLVTFTPAAGVEGTVTFTIELCDLRGGCVTASVQIEVGGVVASTGTSSAALVLAGLATVVLGAIALVAARLERQRRALRPTASAGEGWRSEV
jgi:uncharacterized repeat protein (TIGR01451 family)